MTGQEKQILTRLQRGIQIASRPFAPGELEVLQRAQTDGLVRRFGGIFDARRLGYKSVLCALDVPGEKIEEKAVKICAHPGVTHCYERTPVDCRAGMVENVGSPSADLAPRPAVAGRPAIVPALQRKIRYPNLWFTFAAPLDEFDRELEMLHLPLLQLPAIHRFKIDVVFDLQGCGLFAPAETVSPDVSTCVFSEDEQVLVRVLDQQLPLVEQPFALIARQLGQSEEWVLNTLRAWKDQGILRRIGAILYHRKAGFRANAMCVWPVAQNDIEEAGCRAAACAAVTHCYQRPRLAAFPFDLYAMIHAADQEKIKTLFAEISAECGLGGGTVFESGREFKKTSMKYFREE